MYIHLAALNSYARTQPIIVDNFAVFGRINHEMNKAPNLKKIGRAIWLQKSILVCVLATVVDPKLAVLLKIVAGGLNHNFKHTHVVTV